MKVRCIIAGSRTIKNLDIIMAAVVASNFDIWQVVSGGAAGVDLNGEKYAEGVGIPVKRFPANWKEYGLKAGYLRNVEMADNADALIAIWDGKSRGTKHMIDIATKKGLKVYIHEI